jgi:hypothetical protein
MALFPQPAGSVRHHASHAAGEAAPWVEWLARLGYAARGVVYIIVGALAAQAAFGSGGQVTDSDGALQTILRQPYGQVMLGVVALGLAGYAMWRFVEAALDPEHKGSDAKGIAKRIGYAISGVIHAALAFEAARMVMRGASGGSGGEGADHWTAMLISQPFGPWLVGLVGLGIAAFGLYQLYRAYASDPAKRLSLTGLGATAREWVIRAARLGYAARGVVFGIIGFFVVQAALQYDPSDAVGLGGALRTLQRQSYGPWLLGAVAVGLVAYGIFELVKARYRRIHPAG